MAKKFLMTFFVELTAIFLWLFFIGQLNGQSGVSGDINMIDEGQFAAWVGHMLHGKTIYKDVYTPYGPLQILPIYFLTELFGKTIFFVRLWGGVIGVFLGICVAVLVLRELKINPIIRAITVIFLLLIPGVHIRFWVGILTILLAVKAYEKNSTKLAFLSGILLATSVFISVEVGIFIILIISGYSVLETIQKKAQKDTLVLKANILGAVFMLVIFTLYALSSGWLVSYLGIMKEVLTSLSGVNLPNGQGMPDVFAGHEIVSPLGIAKFLFSKQMLFYWYLLLLLLYMTIVFLRFILQKTTQKDTLVFLMLIFSLLSYVSVVGRSGHSLLYAPFILVCGSYFISLVFPPAYMKDPKGKFISVLFFSLLILYCVRHFAIFRYSPLLSGLVRSTTNSTIPRVAPLAISQSQARDIELLQDFFSTHTKSTDTIFFLNNMPAWYFLLDRENATEFDLPLLAYSREKRLEVVSSLRQNQPIYIIEDINAWAVDGVSDRERLPEIVAYIENHYHKTEKVGHFLLYKR